MRNSEPFIGMLICLFSLASYFDGAIWQSGCCAGIGAMMLIDWLGTFVKRESPNDH